MRTLGKDDKVDVVSKTKNAHGNWWYKTSAGDWVYSGNVDIHTECKYSPDTGLCKCGTEDNDYDKGSMSSTAYQIKGSTRVYLRKYPFPEAPTVDTLDPGEVLYFNYYGYPEAKWYIGKGNKWIRTAEGGWVKAKDVVQHTDKHHEYSNTSEGKCTYTNCKEEKKLTPSGHIKQYEAKSTGVVARAKPYKTAGTKATYSKGQTIAIEQKVTNALDEVWYKTARGGWIYSGDIKLHEHKLSLGSCTSLDCGYAVNKRLNGLLAGKMFQVKVATHLRKQPFDDATSIEYLKVGRCVAADARYIMGAGEKAEQWYLIVGGGYVKVKDMKEHTHSYNAGYCSACGTYAPWTETTITSMVVQAKSAVTVREKPYEKAKAVRTLAKDEEIVIVKQCKNGVKNVWYQLMDGSWIYSGNVKTRSGGTVKTSSKKTIDKYNLTVVDSGNKPIAGATVTWMGETHTTDDSGKVTLTYVTDKTNIVITKAGYDTVTLENHKMSSNKKETITMALAGSYKAVRVVMDYLGQETNLLRTAKTINQYHTQKLFAKEKIKITCEMSASTQAGKFELVQGGKVIATSQTGVFEGLTAKSFAVRKTVFLKIYDKSNTKREEQQLLLNIFNEGSDGVYPNLAVGLGRWEFAIPVNVPLIGGIEFKFDPTSIFNVKYEVDDESHKLTINVEKDFQKESKKESEKESEKEGETWTSIEAYQKFWKTIKENKKDKTAWQQYSKQKAEAASKKSGKLTVEVTGYAEKLHGENIWKGSLGVGIAWKPKPKEKQHVVCGYPIVIETAFVFKASAAGEITVIDMKITDFAIPIDLSVKFEVTASAGLKYVATIGIYGSLTAKFGFQIPIDAKKVNLYVKGDVGVKAKALGVEIFKWNIFDLPEFYIIKEGEFVMFEEGLMESWLLDADAYKPIPRDYLENRSGWYGEGVTLMDEEPPAVIISDLDVEVLQSSTYTDLKPQVVTSSNGTIMMLFTDDNAERAAGDRTMLVYSLYDAGKKQWSRPAAVQDDGTADYGFSVHSVDGDIYVVWQNAKGALPADADITTISKNTEVMVAKYDAALDCFDHVQQVTNNDQYENMPRISAANGKVVVSWITNSEDDIFQTKGENTVWYAVKNDGDYDDDEPYVTPDLSDLPDENAPSEDGEDDDVYSVTPDTDVTVIPNPDYVEPEPTPWDIYSLEPDTRPITSLGVGYMLSDGYVAYTTDEDGNTVTCDDQQIHLLDVQTRELSEYTDKAYNLEFTQVHGRNAMTWYNQGMIYYAYTPELAPQLLFDEETSLTEGYQLISDDKGNMAILFSKNEDDSSEAYMMLYDIENFEWGYPVAVTDQDLYIRDFRGAYLDGEIISIFNRTAIDQTTGAEDNTLCTAIINERMDLKISDVYVNTYDLQPLTETPVTMQVTNAGTRRVEQFEVAMYDEEDVLLDTKVIDQTLKTGETVDVEMSLTMPAEIRQTTYRLVVTEVGTEDVFPDDNENRFLVGQPHLVVDAVSEPTETENIVVLTVTNKGYESQSGSLVRLGADGTVEEVLVERFPAIGHDGDFSCAVLFDEYYFDDEPGMTFSFGVIPDGATEVESETSLYVDRVQFASSANVVIEDSDLEGDGGDEAVLQESREKTISGTLRNFSGKDVTDAVLHVVAYSHNGLYLDTYTQDVEALAMEESLPFDAKFSAELEIGSIRIMLQDKVTMEPLIDVSDMDLVYDTVIDSIPVDGGI